MFQVYSVAVPVIFAIASFLLLSLILIYVYLQSKARTVLRWEALLHETEWKRINRLPLLMEVSQALAVPNVPFEKLTALRHQSMQEGSFPGELSSLTKELIRQGQSQPGAKQDARFLALQMEFQDLFEEAQQYQDQYDEARRSFSETVKKPWNQPYLIFPLFRRLGKNSA